MFKVQNEISCFDKFSHIDQCESNAKARDRKVRYFTGNQIHVKLSVCVFVFILLFSRTQKDIKNEVSQCMSILGWQLRFEGRR